RPARSTLASDLATTRLHRILGGDRQFSGLARVDHDGDREPKPKQRLDQRSGQPANVPADPSPVAATNPVAAEPRQRPRDRPGKDGGSDPELVPREPAKPG